MTSAISSSLSGLQSAQRSLTAAATNIVKSGGFNPASQSLEVKNTSSPTASGSPIQANFSPLPDLTSSLIDLKLAEISYKASAEALKVALEIDRNLIDQVG